MTARHPTTAHWTFPPADRPPLPAPLRRVNLRELEARPDRFEHNLMVVARVGLAQLEVATASEPLYFAHRNISDEYAMPMATGDALADAMPFRTFVSDVDTGADLGRLNHGVNQMVLHPYGFLHWPARLRPPYTPMQFAPSMRRTGYSLVFCGSRPTPPTERPLFVSAGLEPAAKLYTEREFPVLLANLASESAREIALIGDTGLALAVDPSSIAPPRGGYALVLAGSAPYFAGDLVYIPEGARLDGAGIERAAVIASPTAAPEPPPPAWDAAPPPPFPVYEDGEPGALPIAIGELTIAAVDDTTAIATIGGVSTQVPRYWLARMMFRLGLHDYRVGYVETYGGLFYQDTDEEYRLGIRGAPPVWLSRAEVADAVERIYRAVAPPGYVERIR